MFRAWHAGVFLVAVVVFAVALAPAQPFLRQIEGQLTYARIEGRIWDATLFGARIGGLDGGDVGVKLSALALLTGRLEADVQLHGSELDGRVTVSAALDGVLIDAPSLTLSGAPLPGLGRLPGRTSVSGLEIRFAAGKCASAIGRLESNALEQAFADSLRGPGPSLFGAATCVGTAARLPLTGEQDGDALQAWMDIAGDGAGRWRLEVQTRDPQRAAVVLATGLAPSGVAGTFTGEGVFRWLTF